MESFLQNLNSYNGLLIAILTFFLVITNILLFRVSKAIAEENKLMRKAQTEPKIAIFLKSSEVSINLTYIMVTNIGLGPAFEIKAKVTKNSKSLVEKKVYWAKRFPIDGFNVIPQGEKISIFLGGVDLFAEPKLKPFTVEIEYKNIKGDSFSERIVLDIKILEGFVQVGHPPLETIARSLKKLSADFNRVTSAQGKIMVETQTKEERLREDKEWVKDVKKRLAVEKKKESKTS